MHSYEVEIKVLLGTSEQKDIFMDKVHTSFPSLSHSYSESQLNHYFAGGNLAHLFGTFRQYISEKDAASLHNLVTEAKSYSVRTRGTQTQTIIVVKATVNDESSSNGTARIEWEVDLAPMTLDEMDAVVLQAGFAYQAKWSRAREGYQLNENTVLCLDKNAGYGYLAEFERVIDDATLVDSTRTELLQMIESLGYHELDQERLARMFDFYNKNWREYYGTENVFTVE
jgi:adenylate cyclase class IV